MDEPPGRTFGHHAKRASELVRIALAITIEQRVKPWRWLALLVAVLALFPLVQGPRWVGLLLLAVAALASAAITAVVAVAVRVLTPAPVRALRDELRRSVDEVKAAAREIGVPMGVTDGLRFAWATARGRRPHASIAAQADRFEEQLRISLGPERFQQIVTELPERGRA